MSELGVALVCTVDAPGLDSVPDIFRCPRKVNSPARYDWGQEPLWDCRTQFPTYSPKDWYGKRQELTPLWVHDVPCSHQDYVSEDCPPEGAMMRLESPGM